MPCFRRIWSKLGQHVQIVADALKAALKVFRSGAAKPAARAFGGCPRFRPLASCFSLFRHREIASDLVPQPRRPLQRPGSRQHHAKHGQRQQAGEGALDRPCPLLRRRSCLRRRSFQFRLSQTLLHPVEIRVISAATMPASRGRASASGSRQRRASWSSCGSAPQPSRRVCASPRWPSRRGNRCRRSCCSRTRAGR